MVGPTRADDAVDSPGDAVTFVSQVTPIALTNALAAATLINTGVITVMLSGPVLLVVAWLTGSALLTQWGSSFLVALPAVPLLSYGIAWVNARRAEARGNYDPVVVVADHDGLSLEVAGETRRAGWDEFRQWRRVAGAHLLYLEPRRFVVLATAHLDAEARDALEALLRAHVGDRPRRGAGVP